MPRGRFARVEGTQKFCKRCNTNKNINSFSKRADISPNHRTYCKDCINFRARNTESIKEKARIRARETRLKERLLTLWHYSDGEPHCNCCGETEIRFLCIDHINGGGRKHRNIIGRLPIGKWLIKNNYPPGFQVLCQNCNGAKGENKTCPHQEFTKNTILALCAGSSL